jgi:DNA polymerase III delta prime subunit
MKPNNTRDTDWAQKYRPTTLSHCVLPARIKLPLQRMIAAGEVENLIFHGSYGTGKTTTANAICHDANADLFSINGSKDNGISGLREDLEPFASTYSITGGRKVILIDEADGLTKEYQNGLRGFMEEMSKNCSFILTTNHLNKVSEAIRSRCLVLDFGATPEEERDMKRDFARRVKSIVATEGATYDPDVVGAIISTHFPDYRQILKQVKFAANFDGRNSSLSA